MLNENDVKNFNLSVESLMDSACKRTRLSNWGDESFLIPFKNLVDSFNKDNKDYSKNIFFRNECIRLLCNRLTIEKNLEQYPEILDVEIRKPLFIIGLGRTGSTFLHNLLSQDSKCRTLKYWELLRPSPPDVKDISTDLRISLAEKEINAMLRRFPELWNKHELKAANPEECCLLMLHTFMSRHFYVSWNVPTYIEWLCKQNIAHAYEYYKKLLKLLLFCNNGYPLILKDPMHLPHIDILMKMFPDANFVWTHRDPKKVISSYYSLSNTIKGRVPYSEMKHGIEQLAWDIDAAMKIRNNVNPNKFYDVSYVELIKDPVYVIKKIYEHFNYIYDVSMEDNTKSWLQQNPQNKYGIHHHSLEGLDISSDFIKKEFLRYYKRFNDFICC